MLRFLRDRKRRKAMQDEVAIKAILERKTGFKLKVQQETPEQWIKRHTMPQ